MVENIAQKYFRLYKHDMIPQNLNIVRIASRINMEKYNNNKRQIVKGQLSNSHETAVNCSKIRSITLIILQVVVN